MYQLMGRQYCLVLERSLYDVCLCVDFTSLMISESDDYRCGGGASTDTLVTDVVSENTLRAGARWGATTFDCGVNYYGNVG